MFKYNFQGNHRMIREPDLLKNQNKQNAMNRSFLAINTAIPKISDQRKKRKNR